MSPYVTRNVDTFSTSIIEPRYMFLIIRHSFHCAYFILLLQKTNSDIELEGLEREVNRFHQTDLLWKVFILVGFFTRVDFLLCRLCLNNFLISLESLNNATIQLSHV